MTVHSVDRAVLEVHPRSFGSIVSPKSIKELFSKGVTVSLTLKNKSLEEHPSRGNDVWEDVEAGHVLWAKLEAWSG